MREALVTISVGVLCLIAPFNPRIGVLSYVWFSLMRPDILAWATGRPNSLILAMATLVGCVRAIPNIFVLIRTPITAGLILLFIIISLSAVFAVDNSLSVGPYQEYARIVLMALLIPLIIHDLNGFKWLLLVMAASIGAIGFKYGVSGLAAGGLRFAYGVGGMMADNNTMATGLAMGVPLCWYASRLVDSVLLKVGYLVLVLTSVSAIIMTHSRGGALATCAVLLIIAFHSKRRLRTCVLLALFAVPSLYLVKDTYFDRLSTLRDIEGEASAASRVILANAGLRMWRDYPLLGVGFGSLNERRLVGRYLGQDDQRWAGFVLHNTYLQMLVDSGTAAFLVYVFLLIGTIAWLGNSDRRITRAHPGLELYPRALNSALVAFAIGTISLSQVRFDFLYMVLAAAAAWQSIESRLVPPSSPHLQTNEDDLLDPEHTNPANSIQTTSTVAPEANAC